VLRCAYSDISSLEEVVMRLCADAGMSPPTLRHKGDDRTYSDALLRRTLCAIHARAPKLPSHAASFDVASSLEETHARALAAHFKTHSAPGKRPVLRRAAQTRALRTRSTTARSRHPRGCQHHGATRPRGIRRVRGDDIAARREALENLPRARGRRAHDARARPRQRLRPLGAHEIKLGSRKARITSTAVRSAGVGGGRISRGGDGETQTRRAGRACRSNDDAHAAETEEDGETQAAGGDERGGGGRGRGRTNTNEPRKLSTPRRPGWTPAKRWIQALETLYWARSRRRASRDGRMDPRDPREERDPRQWCHIRRCHRWR
jgi:hypothetical protein